MALYGFGCLGPRRQQAEGVGYTEVTRILDPLPNSEGLVVGILEDAAGSGGGGGGGGGGRRWLAVVGGGGGGDDDDDDDDGGDVDDDDDFDDDDDADEIEHLHA